MVVVTSFCTLVSRMVLLAFIVWTNSGAMAEVTAEINLSPTSLSDHVGLRANITVTCNARDIQLRSHNYYYGNRRRYSNYNSNQGTRYTVERLRILMEPLEIGSEEGTWQTLAQVSGLDPEVVHTAPAHTIHSASVTILPDLTSGTSLLRVTWEGPIVNLAKKFRCDVTYFDKEYQQSGQYKRSDGKINLNINGQSMFRLIHVQSNDTRDSLKQLSSKLVKHYKETVVTADWGRKKADLRRMLAVVRSRLEEAVSLQRARNEELERLVSTLLAKSNQKQAADIDRLRNSFTTAVSGSFLQIWPAGNYSLAMPGSGCPSNSGVAWAEGFIRHHTESTERNKDQVTEGNHLQHPVLYRENGQNFVYQHFCVKVDTLSPGPPSWPSGSYCILQNGDCPTGFYSGSVYWDEENGQREEPLSEQAPHCVGSLEGTLCTFCCRDDGAVDQVIELPRSHPFYLYRRGGQCQMVAGMSVTEELIQFDTENSNNGDKVFNKSPDSEFNNIVLHLCYYKQG